MICARKFVFISQNQQQVQLRGVNSIDENFETTTKSNNLSHPTLQTNMAKRYSEATLKSILEDIKDTDEYERKTFQAAREQVRKKEEFKRKEMEWWENREEWVESFPYFPEYHPKIKYSNATFDVELGSMPSSPDNKDDHEAVKKWSEWNRMAAETYTNRLLLSNHGRIKGFYNNPIRFSVAFEMFYNIMNEYGYADNTAMMTMAFTPLVSYYEAMRKNPNEMVPVSGRNYSWKERAEDRLSSIRLPDTIGPEKWG